MVRSATETVTEGQRMDDAGAIAWIRGDVAEMAALLREPRPAAGARVPGLVRVGSELEHIAIGFAAWYPYNMSTPADSWRVEGLMARFAAVGDDHSQNVDAFESGAAEFLGYCSEMDLTQPSWSFGAVEPAGWWIRRAGTELTVHLTDAAGVLGRARIDLTGGALRSDRRSDVADHAQARSPEAGDDPAHR